MRKAILYQYSLPMEAGVVLRNQRLKNREGLIVCLQNNAFEGWGEIAPLPEFSHETLAEATVNAQVWLQHWFAGNLCEESHLPSVAFGISCALAELSGLMPQSANYQTVPLCHGDPDELFAYLVKMPGKKIAKVKVGLYEAIRDGMIVNMLLEAIPDLTLRLDANRSWSKAKADSFAKYVNPAFRERIDFLEEPCKTRDESRQFANEHAIAIAWDESVREDDFTVVAEDNVAAIIIKPTLTGSIDYCQSLIVQAQQQGLTAVISSSIESSLGLTQLARLADWLTPGEIPGLDTLSLMQAQLIRAWPETNLPLLTQADLTIIWQS